MLPPETTWTRLTDEYEVLFLDAYGVLITHAGAISGAVELISEFNRRRRPYFILTNDASRSPENTARRYQEMGLIIDRDRVITSGSALAPYFADQGLAGFRCAVLGPDEAKDHVQEAGGRVVSLDDDIDALVVCDERGYPLRETLDRAVSVLIRLIDAGRPPRLILANPDVLYPAGGDRFGFTAGAIAGLLELGIRSRFPDDPGLRFEALGKPQPAMFEEAVRRAGTRNAVMVGDTLETDIRGAVSLGIDSALVVSDPGGLDVSRFPAATRPTYLLAWP